MFALPIAKPRFKSIIFNQNSPKIMIFLQKNAKISSAGDSAPRPLCLQRLEALPPNPQPPAAGGFAPRPPKQLPHCEFLATHLDHTKGMFHSFVVGLHPTLTKNRTEFEWRPFFSFFFFFCSSADFGQNIGLNLGATISYSDLCSSQIFWSSWPPFSKSCVRYWTWGHRRSQGGPPSPLQSKCLQW